jgi:hypothetical protein
LLGHLARLVGLPLVWMFHLSRIAAGICMLSALWQFCMWCAGRDESRAWRMFLLAGVGSGLGWLAALSTGYLSGDFWIAEAYPFLSLYANPHFPLGMALLLWSCCLVFEEEKKRLVLLPVASLLLGLVQPFGLVVLAFALAGFILSGLPKIRPGDLFRFALAILPGGLILVYQLVAIRSDPALRLWDSQNLTPAPPGFDLLISFSPALIFAVFGVYRAWRWNDQPAKMLSVWLVMGVIAVYLPFNLQRRFLSALYIPIACLAIPGIYFVAGKLKQGMWVWPLVVGISLLTNVMLLVSAVPAVFRQDEILYLSKGEADAMLWLKENTPAETTILASPETGMYIPAWSGRHVVYGHPFESVQAQEAEKLTRGFFSGSLDAPGQKSFIQDRKIEVIFFGPREQSLGQIPVAWKTNVLYQNDEVTLFRSLP